MENKTQELKERIYKHCPELKELTRGCEIRYGNKKMIVDCNGLYENSIMTLYPRLCLTKEMREYDKTFKILGHPIHLEHVLRAIHNSQYAMSVAINDHGMIDVLNLINGKNTAVSFRYKLESTFDQNCTDNPELVDFLLEIIK